MVYVNAAGAVPDFVALRKAGGDPEIGYIIAWTAPAGAGAQLLTNRSGPVR